MDDSTRTPTAAAAVIAELDATLVAWREHAIALSVGTEAEALARRAVARAL